MQRQIPCAFLILFSAVCGPRVLIASSGEALISVELHPAVTNLEWAAFALDREPSVAAASMPLLKGDAWFGQIMRRLPGEGIDDTKNYVRFLVEYVGGTATRVWVDENFNGNLADDPPLPLYLYPPLAGSRCAIARLSWRVPVNGGVTAVTSVVRIIAGPVPRSGAAPICRLQNVYAMQGKVAIDGVSHLAILYDGNGDGIYSTAPLDGILIDLNDDRKFDVDLASGEFFPMRVPFRIGKAVFKVASVDPSGQRLVLQRIGNALVSERAKVGSPAPDFQCYDTDGRRFHLSDHRGRPVVLYFWASWCNFCRGEAPHLTSLYTRYRPKGVEMFAISLDGNKNEMASFRKQTGEPWPTTFTGGSYWEDPVARLYGVDGAGGCYLIDGAGRLLGVYYDHRKLEARLSELAGGTD